MPSALRYITKDSHPIIQDISKSNGLPVRGRRYDPSYATKSGGIQLSEVIKGAQYAFVSIVDDKPNTLHKVGAANPWYLHVMKMMMGNTEQAHLPLTTILQSDVFQLHTIDQILDITGHTKAGHALDTQGYIAHNDDTIVLAYRCTTSAKDWVTNLTMTTSAWEIDTDVQQGHSGYFSSCSNFSWCGFNTSGDDIKPRVHTGFYNNFLCTVPSIRQYIDPLLTDDQPPRTLYVVGHSLGAGIAMMAACYFIMEPQYQKIWRNNTLQHKLRVVTVGGPRACCQSMQQRVDTVLRELRPTNKVQVVQLVRDKDCVPTVPPEMFGFRHLQEKTVYITKEDKDTGRSHVIINPDLRQVIRKKKYQQLVKEKPEVFAPYVVTQSTIDDANNDANNNNNDDDIESVSDTDDMNRGITIENNDDDDNISAIEVEDVTKTNFDDNTLTETEWIEKYNKKIKLIPRVFRDHMPDFYYQPLLLLKQHIEEQEGTNHEQQQTNSKSTNTTNPVTDTTKDETTITNTSESDDDQQQIPYQSLNSNDSSVNEPQKQPNVEPKRQRFRIFGRGRKSYTIKN